MNKLKDCLSMWLAIGFKACGALPALIRFRVVCYYQKPPVMVLMVLIYFYNPGLYNPILVFQSKNLKGFSVT